MKRLAVTLISFLCFHAAHAGICKVEQVRFENIDIDEISHRYRVGEADTFAKCLKKSLDGQLRGTSYLKYTEETEGEKTSYLLYFGKIKQRL